jgi:hypothetical protein
LIKVVWEGTTLLFLLTSNFGGFLVFIRINCLDKNLLDIGAIKIAPYNAHLPDERLSGSCDLGEGAYPPNGELSLPINYS